MAASGESAGKGGSAEDEPGGNPGSRPDGRPDDQPDGRSDGTAVPRTGWFRSRKSALPVDPDAEVPPPTPQPDLHQHPQPHPHLHPHPHSLRVLGAIAVGGFAGGLARYELGLTFPTRHGAFPATTFAINVSGSFVLALLLVYILEIWPPTRYVRPLLGVGFCGAYTTFSTWMVDTDRLLADKHYANAALNVGGSLVAGLAATSLGLTCGRAVVAHRRRVADLRAQKAEQDKVGV